MSQGVAHSLEHTPLWRRELTDAVRDAAELLRLLELPLELLPGAQLGAQLFPLRVPQGYVARMRKGDPHDPLLRQVLPLDAETQSAPGFVHDPVGDLAAVASPGLLHKYQGRVLMVTTGACAVHCRYCFRRHYPYSDEALHHQHIDRTLNYIASDNSINEVILSGGDPLSVSDERLATLVARIADISHIQRLRIHSRLPVVLPARITKELVHWLTASRLQPVMVIHANHPQELDGAVAKALDLLHAAGVTLLNQSVLLRGVNDHAATLIKLSEQLFTLHTLPYYLHQLDRVAGAAHFQVEDAQARALHETMLARLPGYLVPRLVREIPGAASKRELPG